jgi:amidase
VTVFVEHCSLGTGRLKVAVKDCIDVAGFASRSGSEALATAAAATRHADVVERILAADCELVGKLNMHELAYGMSGVNNWTGTPINAYYPAFIPGGSSSGSAVAVAMGSVDFSLGTDTGGSVRLPAACCGVYGLKPTFGRVSRKGLMPAESSLDCVGPFADSAAGIITAMTVIDPGFTPLTELPPITLGRVRVAADDQIQQAVDAVADRSGFASSAIELPLMEAAFIAAMTVINAETWRSCGDLLQTGKVGADVAKRLLAAKDTTPAQLQQAEQVRQQFTEQVDAALQLTPILFMPALPNFPLSLDAALAGQADLTSSAFLRPFNLSGHPAIVLPLAAIDGKPAAMQLVAGKGCDELLCEVARQLSQFIS